MLEKDEDVLEKRLKEDVLRKDENLPGNTRHIGGRYTFLLVKTYQVKEM